MVEINAIEDIDAFMKASSSRNKLYKVYVNSKLYENMEITYNQTSDGDFFTFRTVRKGGKGWK